MLRQKGIDLDHNRFLILQGEVEQISQMKPKAENKNEEGMLEYLEDIIGSSRLKPFIEKLSNQVDQLNEHRTQRNERVKLKVQSLFGLSKITQLLERILMEHIESISSLESELLIFTLHKACRNRP